MLMAGAFYEGDFEAPFLIEDIQPLDGLIA